MNTNFQALLSSFTPEQLQALAAAAAVPAAPVQDLSTILETKIEAGDYKAFDKNQLIALLKSPDYALNFTLNCLTNTIEMASNKSVNRITSIIDKTTNTEFIANTYDDLCKQLYGIYSVFVSRFNTNNKTNIQAVNDSTFNKKLDTVVINLDHSLTKRISKALSYDGVTTKAEAEALYRIIVTTMTKGIDENLIDLHVKNLMYWIASVKLALDNSNEVPYRPKMLYLYGAMGMHKSVISNYLIEPIGQSNARKIGMSSFDNAAGYSAIMSKPVVTIDEFSTITSTKVKDTLKQMITLSEIQTRKLHTGNYIEQKSVASFIACSNWTSNTTIADSQGNRRIWEITVNNVNDDSVIIALYKSGYFTKLYTSIDALKVIREIESDIDLQARIATQQAFVLNGDDVITTFMSAYGIVSSEDTNGTVINSTDFLEMLLVWAKRYDKLDELDKLGLIERDLISSKAVEARIGKITGKLLEVDTKGIKHPVKPRSRSVYLVDMNTNGKQMLNNLRS